MTVLTAEITDRAKHRSRRGDRRPMHTAAQYRRGTMRETVEVLDLSYTGARLRALAPLRVGHIVFLRIAHLQPVEARIMWTEGFDSGCEFAHPLHPAVFDTLGPAAS